MEDMEEKGAKLECYKCEGTKMNKKGTKPCRKCKGTGFIQTSFKGDLEKLLADEVRKFVTSAEHMK
jgi:RecJ-like exonuclease